MMSAEKKVWSDGEIQTLIALYEENSILWDVRAENYRNRVKKQEVLESLAVKFNTTSNEISRKLHNLRSQFMQELKKIKKRKSGTGADEVYLSPWPYFSALKFIGPSASNALTTDNLVSTNFLFHFNFLIN